MIEVEVDKPLGLSLGQKPGGGVIITRGSAVDVTKLQKRPAPPRFGRKLTDALKARATRICLDCGFMYTLSKPFEEQSDKYVCPQCRALKKRFAQYDVNTGKAVGGASRPICMIIGLVAGIGTIGTLLVYVVFSNENLKL